MGITRMAYRDSLTKKELIHMLDDVPDDHEIFIVNNGESPMAFCGNC
jgi:hypothetical protein